MEEERFERFHQSYRNQRGLVPKQDFDSSALEEMTLSADVGKGEFLCRKLRPGLRLSTAGWRVHNARIERFTVSNASLVELHGCMQGVSEALVNGAPLTVAPERITLSFLKSVETETLFTPGQHYRSWSITMTSEVFDHFVGTYDDNIRGHDHRYFMGTELYKGFQWQMNADVKLIIQQIQNCPYRASLRNVYMEGKVLELCSMFMHEWLDGKPAAGLRRTDVLKLQHAKEVLLSRLDKPPSLVELAKISGLNDFKLKKGFKEVFGTTVFGILREARMNRALDLIRTGEMNVSQVAWTVGYSNLSHFTAMFREKFGMNPSDWLREHRKSVER